jgi:putative ABC transport system permease protein
MSALRERDGGMPARLATLRWARRLVRRQWRQHLLIVSIISVALAVTILLSTAAYNVAPAEGRAEFGDADTALPLDDIDPAVLAATVSAAEDAFGEVDAIGHRTVAIPGSLKSVDYRSQDVDGAFGSPLIAVTEGRAPTDLTEAAITDWVASVMAIGVGDTIDLDGTPRRIVGIVENPTDLDDEFVALAPLALADSQSVTLLVKSDDGDFARYDPPPGGPRIVSGRSDVPEDVLAGVLMLLASTVLMFMVALIAAASFTVIAQRRLPQFGMLAAVGATERHVRSTMVATGAFTGVLAGVTGAAVGLLCWFAAAPSIESIVNYRIDAWNVPWWLVIAAIALAVAAATGAAWWPARTMSRIPPVLALHGRIPRPLPARRSALAAVTMLACGVACLRVGSDFDGDGPSTVEMVLMALGTLLVIAGVLLVSPVLIRGLGHLARGVPISVRLALRDLSRYQSRSGAALAAIGLALGIPSVIVASTAAAENQQGLGNLAATHLLVRPDAIDGPFLPPDAAGLAAIAEGVEAIVEATPTATAIPLAVVLDPDAPTEPDIDARPTLGVVRRVEQGYQHVAGVYAATPEVLAAFGLAADSLAASDDVVTVDDGDDLFLFGTPGTAVERLGQGRPLTTTGTLTESFSSLPGALVDPEVARRRGWETADGGRWLVESAVPFTDEQLRVARDLATRYGFVIESRDDNSNLPTVRLAAGAAGMLMALSVLAMTVGLMRGESANDVRTLTATGATRSTRRGVTAVTAGSLAALGASLGISAAYIGLVGGRLEDLTPLPWRDLTMIGAGTPLIAAIGAWLLAGREPAGVARTALE